MAKTPIVITITSNKGGVGKTTTAAALCDILRHKYHVLLVDTDPQCNCAGKFGFDAPTSSGNLGSLLIAVTMRLEDPKPIQEYIAVNDAYPNLGILYGGKTLKTSCYDYIFSASASAALKSFKRIFKMVNELDLFDFIIIDTPPTYGNEMSAILNATNYALLPTVAESDSVEGVDVALRFIADAREDNPGLKVAGIFLNRVYNNDSATHAVEPFIRDAWDKDVLNTRIPDNRAAVSKAINDGEPITTCAPSSKASIAFHELTKEVLDRVAQKHAE